MNFKLCPLSVKHGTATRRSGRCGAGVLRHHQHGHAAQLFRRVGLGLSRPAGVGENRRGISPEARRIEQWLIADRAGYVVNLRMAGRISALFRRRVRSGSCRRQDCHAGYGIRFAGRLFPAEQIQEDNKPGH